MSNESLIVNCQLSILNEIANSEWQMWIDERWWRTRCVDSTAEKRTKAWPLLSRRRGDREVRSDQLNSSNF